MAIQNDPRLFTGGNVEFPKPHTELYFKLLQQEQAKNDAFDEYMRNLNMKVNPAGMRNNEVPVFNDKLKKWQEYGMQNREALRNPRKDGGRASMEFQAGYQDLQNLIARSKGIEELKKPGVEVMTDPAKFDRVNKDKLMKGFYATDQDLQVQDPKTGEWVDNPNWRPFNPTDIEFKNKPFDQTKFRGLFKDIKRQELSPEIVKDPKNLTQTVTKRAIFDEPAKDQIAEMAVTEYMADPSTKEFIDKLDPSEYNDFFKKNYGHDIQTPGDLAAAYALKTQQEEVITSELKDDTFARQKAMQAIRNADARGLIRLRDDLKDADEATNDLWYDSFIDKLTQEAQAQPSKLYPGAGLGWEIPIDPFVAKGLSKDGSSPDKLIYTTDGKYVPVFYQRDGDGKLKYREGGGDAFPITNSTKTAPIDRTQFKVSIGGKGGVKQLNKEMSSGGGGQQSGYSNEQPATYKGKKITAGIKNGKWYNTQTGEEIK